MADQVNSVVKPKRMGRIKVQSMNVRNLNTKVLLVDAFLQQHAPDVLFLQEADIAEGVSVVFEGYTTHYSDFCCGDRNTARTIALVKASTGLKALPPLKLFHSVAVPVTLADGRSLLLIGVYRQFQDGKGSRSHHFQEQQLLHLFKDYVELQQERHDEVALIGDFNIDPTKLNTPTYEHRRLTDLWLQETTKLGLNYRPTS